MILVMRDLSHTVSYFVVQSIYVRVRVCVRAPACTITRLPNHMRVHEAVVAALRAFRMLNVDFSSKLLYF